MMMHSALIAEQSPVLRNLVSGPMEEAQARTVSWEDVDVDTFGLFAEFVYTGDYTPLAHITSEGPPATSTRAEQEQKAVSNSVEESFDQPQEPPDLYDPDGDYGGFGFHPKNRATNFPATTVSSSVPYRFKDESYPLPTSLESKATFKPRPNETSNEDYSPVFLCHAHLYALAEKYDIEALKATTLHKLHKTLCCYSPYEARNGDIIELARYVYQNTPTREWIDRLRELVTLYIAYEAETIASSEPCLSLIEEGGPFARDLFSKVLSKKQTR